MASFTKRNKSWRCVIRCKGYPTLSKTFPTKTLAQQWALDTEQNIAAATKTLPTLKDCLIRYSKEITPLKKGRERELQRINNLLKLPLTSMPINDVKPSDLASLRDMRLSQGKKPATVRLELMTLSHVFTIAIKEWDMTLTNPVQNIRKPSVNNARTRRLEGDELERILKHCSNEMRAWIIVAIETAMRRSEQHSLSYGMIQGNVIRLADTKNGESRTIPLSSKALAALNSLKLKTTTGIGKDSKGGSIWAFAIWYYTHEFVHICKLEGIVGIRLHDLRREGVSRLFEKGLNMFEVKAISGHKSTKMLERYVRVDLASLLAKLG